MTRPAPGPRGPCLTLRPGLTRPGPWVKRALCARDDPDTWFPADEEDPELAAAAIEVCFRCPVRPDCLAHAQANRERHGIWGGLTPRQRLSLRTRQEKAA